MPLEMPKPIKLPDVDIYNKESQVQEVRKADLSPKFVPGYNTNEAKPFNTSFSIANGYRVTDPLRNEYNNKFDLTINELGKIPRINPDTEQLITRNLNRIIFVKLVLPDVGIIYPLYSMELINRGVIFVDAGSNNRLIVLLRNGRAYAIESKSLSYPSRISNLFIELVQRIDTGDKSPDTLIDMEDMLYSLLRY